MPRPQVISRARRLRASLRTAAQLSELEPDELLALRRLARTVAQENVTARKAPGIDASAWISPLASLRFTDRVSIGPKTSVGPHCCIWGGWSTAQIRIEGNVLLGPGVVVVAGNHGTDGTGPIREEPIVEQDVSIGEGAWIGAHATIVGCRIGRGAVVGAGAVVLSDVPDLAIAVGSPAKVVGHRS